MENSLRIKAHRAAESKLSQIIDNFDAFNMKLYRKECVCLYAANIRYNNALVGSVRLFEGKKGIEYEVTTV